jgi:hypothetical protein
VWVCPAPHPFAERTRLVAELLTGRDGPLRISEHLVGGRPYDLKRACELDVNEQARGRTVYFILRGARQTGLKRPAGTEILLRLWAGLRRMESLMGCTRGRGKHGEAYTSQV